MKVENCFYVSCLPSTKVERVNAMVSNLNLEVAEIDHPHAVLKLKNASTRATVEKKLDNSGLFNRVVFLKNFNLE